MEHEGRHIPNRLRKQRKASGLTLEEVAYALGLRDTSRISRWENGLSIPSLKHVLRLGLLYDKLTDELFFEQRDELREEMKERKEKVLARKAARAKKRKQHSSH